MTSVRGETRSSRRSIFARLREMTQLMRDNMQPKETQPETLDALVKKEIRQWTEVVQRANIKPEN